MARIQPLSRSIVHVFCLLFALLIAHSAAGCVFYFDVFDFSPEKSHATQAEELEEQGKLEEAIAQYEKHIEKRLRAKSRPDHENPHFYQILIGDLYLRLDRPDAAKQAFESAHQNGVNVEFVSERFRRLAHWYAKRERFNEALELLARYRELDPFMYDIDTDTIHKQLVKKDQQAADGGFGVTPPPEKTEKKHDK